MVRDELGRAYRVGDGVLMLPIKRDESEPVSTLAGFKRWIVVIEEILDDQARLTPCCPLSSGLFQLHFDRDLLLPAESAGAVLLAVGRHGAR